MRRETHRHRQAGRLPSVALSFSLTEPGAAALGTKRGDEQAGDEDRESSEGHGGRVGPVPREEGLQPHHAAGQQDAALIREPWKKAADRIWRKLRDMSWDDAPGALHHELQQERAKHQQASSRRIRPKRNQHNSQRERQNHRTPAPDAVREQPENNAAHERSYVVDNGY